MTLQEIGIDRKGSIDLQEVNELFSILGKLDKKKTRLWEEQSISQNTQHHSQSLLGPYSAYTHSNW